MKNISIGYFADGNWGYETLKRIILEKKIKLNFVCLRYEKPDNKIIEYCKKNKIKFYIFKNINSKKNFRIIFDYKCDLIVSMSYDQIFGSLYQKFFPSRIINCHAGKLPFYRGRNFLNWVLINDEKEFGVTVHFVDERIDTGDIILQKTYPVTDDDTYETLLGKSYSACAEILYESLVQIAENSYKRTIQSAIHPTGFYCGKRVRGDEVINWNDTSRGVFNFIRAISKPGPIARTKNGDEEIAINRATYIEDVPSYKGSVGQILSKSEHGFLVKTKDSFIEILEVQGNLKIGDRLGI